MIYLIKLSPILQDNSEKFSFLNMDSNCYISVNDKHVFENLIDFYECIINDTELTRCTLVDCCLLLDPFTFKEFISLKTYIAKKKENK